MKKILKIISLMVLLLLFGCKNWKEQAIQDYLQKGYILVDQQETRIAFIHKKNIVKFDGKIVYFKIFWIDKDNGEDEFIKVLNCNNLEDSFLEKELDIENVDFSKLEWEKADYPVNKNICGIISE